MLPFRTFYVPQILYVSIFNFIIPTGTIIYYYVITGSLIEGKFQS